MMILYKVCVYLKLISDILISNALLGLSAALMLQTKGVKVVVLEAQNRVGGRTLTEEVRSW